MKPVPSSPSLRIDRRLLRLASTDTCVVVCAPIPAGSRLRMGRTELVVAQPLARGITIASRPLRAGDEVRMCGTVIGRATRAIAAGMPLCRQALASEADPAPPHRIPRIGRARPHAAGPGHRGMRTIH